MGRGEMGGGIEGGWLVQVRRTLDEQRPEGSTAGGRAASTQARLLAQNHMAFD